MTDDATDKSPIVRLTGFQLPYSRDQYISCAGHLLSSAALYACLTAMVAQSQTNPVLADYQSKERYIVIALLVHLVIMILLLYAWYSCESCDPGEMSEEPKPWFGIVMKGPRWEKTKYCAVCRKTVPGMDHHCTWLNTCVGRKNYAQFFTIAICGTILPLNAKDS
ncbi:hypothetical protein THRCLA_22807 [Thraustotheca clavata]|uniref:Palmitoyltransferase n=1 Tax=Thraustotheca clavata TaxID=74557 RepID=A0A1V9YSM3_9STRA|nr:hypothetical protein THRCLA_22807 [Thraustotheca clavata]